ncbi:MAG: phosphoribosylglycinamide formyltransferase [Candidatus Nanopelagicales bacterium]|nr:phosphoribosylglycinamide formyltransferase [Candidatus Nanopelagicales bacterium]
MTTPRVVVLASGTGSLFEAILQSNVGAEVSALVTDVRTCGAVQIAARHHIPITVVELSRWETRAQWDQALRDALALWDPTLIVSAGFMRVLGPVVVDAFPGRIINAHPSLLPAFPGAHAVRDALAAEATVTGCTVHYVDHGVDTGPIVAQQSLDIYPGESEQELHERIKQIERVLLPTTIYQLLRDPSLLRDHPSH